MNDQLLINLRIMQNPDEKITHNFELTHTEIYNDVYLELDRGILPARPRILLAQQVPQRLLSNACFCPLYHCLCESLKIRKYIPIMLLGDILGLNDNQQVRKTCIKILYFSKIYSS